MNNKKIMDACRAGPGADGKGVTRAPSWLDCRQWSDMIGNKCYIPAAEQPTPRQAIRHDFATSITVKILHPSNLGQDAYKSRFSSLGFSLGGRVHKRNGRRPGGNAYQSRTEPPYFRIILQFRIDIFYTYIYTRYPIILKSMLWDTDTATVIFGRTNKNEASNLSGWDLAVLFERLMANAKVATFLGSIPATSDTEKSEGRQVKQCLIQYIYQNPVQNGCTKSNISKYCRKVNLV